MELVDLVIQGLNGAPELQRIVFGPATIVPITNPREKHAVRIVLEMLYPRALQDSEPALADLDDKSGNSRLALTVLARDKSRWRLLMDLSNGRRALQKIVGEKPEMVSTSPAEIAQVVTAQLGFPQEDVARELLFCQRESLPSRRAKKGGGVAEPSGAVQRPNVEKPLPPGFGDTNPGVSKPLPPGFGDGGGGSGIGASVYASWSEGDLKKRLAEIDTVLDAQKGTKEVEFELDGLQKKNFELEAKLKPLLTLRRSVEQAVEQVRRYSSVDRVPSDLVEKGERLKRIRVEHQGELARLSDEKDSLVKSVVGGDERAMHHSPLAIAQKDPLVLYGVAGGVGALLVGFAGGAAMESLRWLALLDIPAFGVAVYGAIRVLSSLEDREIVRRRLKRLDDDRRRAIERFKIDEEQIQGLLEKHGYQLEALPELQQQLVARDDARRMLDQTRAALEEKLQLSSAGFGASAGDLQAERGEIQAALDALQSGSAPAAKASAPAAPVAAPEPAADARASSMGLMPAEDLCKRVLEVTRDVFMSTVEDVANQTAPRAGQIALALTDGRYKEVRFGGRGECSVVDAASDEVLPFTLLPAGDRDLVYLSVRIAAIEAVTKRERYPVVFDRGLDGFPDAKGPLLKRMLQFLAASAQVACFTEKAALR